MSDSPQFVFPDWPAPKNIRALTTTRIGGFSRGPYASFNLGNPDQDSDVVKNREVLHAVLQLPAEPLWLKQVHGTDVIDAAIAAPDTTADGAWTDRRGVVLGVRTADCLPVFLCDRAGTKVALLHAGWRGLAGGVVEAGVHALAVPGAELLAHIGPGIGPDAYEVGDEVRTAFVRHDPAAAQAFVARNGGHWLANMYALARLRLRALGLTQISVDRDACTLRQPDKYFSYRRDGVCGRMASLVWME